MLPKALPHLTSDALTLRPLRIQDTEALFAIYGDAQVMRHTSDDPFPGPETVAEMLRSVDRLLARGESLEWGIECNQTGALIGTCGLHGFDAGLTTAEVGCLLLRSAWGKGVMRHALSVLMGYATGPLRLKRLRADIDAPNLRSIRLFVALGFVPIGGTLYERQSDEFPQP